MFYLQFTRMIKIVMIRILWKKNWSNAIDKKIKIWRKKMLFANFVNSVSNNTFNKFKILMIAEYEISQTMSSDDNVSNDIRRWMKKWREWRQNCKFFWKNKRINFRTIRLKWKTIRLKWKSNKMKFSKLNKSERIDENWSKSWWKFFAKMTFNEWVSINKQQTWTLMKNNEKEW